MDDWKTSLILADLQAACNALGGWEDDKYVKEADCIDSLRDLMRYLHKDDEGFTVRRALGKINVIRTDLIPLLRFYPEDDDIFEITLKLIIKLTTPVIVLFNEELPVEKNARNIYMTLELVNCVYKEAFLEKEVWSVLGERLEKLMNIADGDKTEDDKETMERILKLIRNVLQPIHKDELHQKTDGDVSTHDRLIWAFHLAGIDDLIIFMCASRMEKTFALYVLEILHLILREQEPQYLAATGTQRSNEEVQREVDDLLRMRDIEKRKKRDEMKSVLHNRFARFSSTYQVRNIKSLGDKTELIVVGDQAKVLESLNNMDFDKKKKFRARAKNRRPEACASIKRKTTLNIRLFLKEFCTELMNIAFNSLVKQTRTALKKVDEDGMNGNYIWLLEFFLSFNRLTSFDIAVVSEAIAYDTFDFVYQKIEKCHEMMVTDKRRIHLWVRRLHIFLRGYKQCLIYVQAMTQHNDEQVREAAQLLQKHLLSVSEYQELALHLLLNFNENFSPIDLLRDLSTIVHIYLRMLERFSKSCKGSRTKKLAGPDIQLLPAVQGLSEDELNSIWMDVSSEIAKVLGDESSSQIDFDINEFLEGYHQHGESVHVEVCEKKLTELLRLKQVEQAVGLLHACRRHFDKAAFGDSDSTPEDEYLLFKKFLYRSYANSAKVDDEDEETFRRNFDFEGFLKRFVNPKVIKAYSLLLSHYEGNSVDVNKICLKMLHRIAFDLKMSSMLFQAEIFVTFDKILDSVRVLPEDKVLQELSRFAKYIVQQFVELTKTNEVALVELLFWKTSLEGYQILHGYNETEVSKSRAWTESEEEELKQLFEELNEKVAPGEDVIDQVQKRFSNDTRTRRQIIHHLKTMGVVEKGARFKAGGTSSRQPWSPEEEDELRELYQAHHESVDPLQIIMLNMTVKRPKFRIVEKLLELGCIYDRSQVRKRRVRKNGEVVIPRRPEERGKNSSESEAGSEDEAVEGRERSGGREATQKPKRKTKVRKPTKRVEKIVNSDELQSLLKTAAEERRDALSWIVDSMEDALTDWKDGGNEAVPLVPMAPAEYESLEDENFCRLLSTFGFVQPSDGVEQYWRVCGSLTRSMLESRLNALQKAMDGSFGEGIAEVDEDANDEGDRGSQESQSSDDEDASQRSASDGEADTSQVSQSGDKADTSQRGRADTSQSDGGAETSQISEAASQSDRGDENEPAERSDKENELAAEIPTESGARKRSGTSGQGRKKKRRVQVESDSDDEPSADISMESKAPSPAKVIKLEPNAQRKPRKFVLLDSDEDE